MQNLKKYLPLILAVIGAGAFTNAGIVFNASQATDGANIKLWIEIILSAIAGLGSAGYVAKRSLSGTAVSEPDAAQRFAASMDSIQQLSVECRGCEESRDALETLTVKIVERLNNA